MHLQVNNPVEACPSAHHWGRELTGLGHTVNWREAPIERGHPRVSANLFKSIVPVTGGANPIQSIADLR